MGIQCRRNRVLKELAGRARKKVLIVAHQDIASATWTVIDKSGTSYRVSMIDLRRRGLWRGASTVGMV